MSLLKSSLVVSFWTFASRILGFFRDLVLANKLGAGTASDAFFIALALPNLLRRLFAEGAFNVAFVPLLSREKENSPENARLFASAVFSVLLLVVLGVIVGAELAMPWLVTFLAPGFKADPEKFQLTVDLGRITFPYLGLITMAAFLGAICNTLKRFAVYAAVPSLLNIALLAGLFSSPFLGVEPVYAAAIAVPVGGIMQAAVMLWATKRAGFTLTLFKSFSHPQLGTLLTRLGPAALGVGVLQISFIVDNQVASLLGGDSAVSFLQYANRFYQLPLALIGIAMATVLLPHFSKALSNNDRAEASRSFGQALSGGMTLALAATVGLFMLAQELMATLFQHGEFTASMAQATAWAMMAYSIGLPGYILTKITASAFFAHEDTKTPVKAAIIALIVNVIANITLALHFGHVGIALATAISGWTNAGVQLYWLKKQNFIDIPLMKEAKNLGQAALLSAIMAGALLGYKMLFSVGESSVAEFIWLIGALSLAAAIFGTGLHVTGIFPLKRVGYLLRRR